MAASSLSSARPVAFLDRDGVLNVDRHYVHRADQLEWIDGVPEAIRLLNEAGYLVIVVTNQSGVARGFYDEAAVGALHDHMRDYLAAHGARIDAFYYCPHHPEGKVPAFTRLCDCRKPGTGMLDQAAHDFPIDRTRSFMIGDKVSDIEAANAFGIRGVMFDGASDKLADVARRMLTSG